MKQINIFYFFILSLLLLNGCISYKHINYKVIDENGNPVIGAKVTAGCYTGGGWDGRKEQSFHKSGETNKDGIFTYIDTHCNDVSAGAKKNGYYAAGSEGKSGITGNYHIINLRKIHNQVRMYAKSVDKLAPIIVGTVGYDLLAGDFVKPNGKGEISDLVFHFNSDHFIDDITFSNSEDGLIPFFYYGRSSFTADYTAPQNGYLSSLSQADELSYKMKCERFKLTGGIDSRAYKYYCENDNYKKNDPYSDFYRSVHDSVKYYIKVRSQGNGSAMFGYMTRFWYLPLGKGKPPYIRFTYYLNPDGTNNIEYGGSFFESSSKVGSENPPYVAK